MEHAGPVPSERRDDGAVEQAARALLPYPLKRIGPARQVVIVTSRTWTSTIAELRAYQDGDHGWRLVLGPVQARIGRTGMIAAARRVQGSGTTPSGTFSLTMAFGLEPDPGTRLPYTHVISQDHWWVADPMSPHYNTLRAGERGGFHPTEAGRRASERIVSHRAEYPYAIVVDFNRPAPTRTMGSGIFLRATTGFSTDGSVALDREPLLELLCWLDPDLHPVVVIAPERAVAEA